MTFSEVETERPYIVVSADTHAGGSFEQYREYLPRKWHDEFDAWAADFSDDWSQLDDDNDEIHYGVSDFSSPVNWDSDLRLGLLDEQGIAAEVLYPNTVPPFYPSGVITAPAPRNQEEYRLRWAGVQAHNRWLVDFCAMTPGRRAGLAQLFFNDLDAAIAEAKFARDNGLVGVLLPPDNFNKLNNWFLPELDAVWRTLEELELPVHSHSVIPSNAATVDGPASPAIGLLEGTYFSKRPIAHLLFGGVFERFPKLRYVITELTCSWAPAHLATLDAYYDELLRPGTFPNTFASEVSTMLTKKPSEYFATNCYFGTYLTPLDIAGLDEIGIDRVMWGADFPHHEGTWPYTREALRVNFSNIAQADVQRMTSLTAIEVYGLDEVKLQAVADKIGPLPSEIAQPLLPNEMPADSPCMTFSERTIFDDM